jgi:hypothetical protein
MIEILEVELHRNINQPFHGHGYDKLRLVFFMLMAQVAVNIKIFYIPLL